MEAIQPDGSLSNEMARARRALHYHLYSLAPLVILAELLEENSTHAYEAIGGAIDRLVGLALKCLDDPILEKRTGVRQVKTLPYSGQEIGWAVPYVHRFPSSPYTAQLNELLAGAPWVSFWQWGGMPPQ